MAVKVPENLRELIELYQEERADQTCIFWRDEEITYRQLNERVNRVANGLKALGVKKGDVVSVYLPNCPDYYYVWFGILKLGAVFGPINAMFKGDEVRHVLSDSGAVALITAEALLDTINAIRGQCPALRDVICLEGERAGATAYAKLMEHSAELAPVEIARDDLAAIVYTSGTTGKPKGAMLSHWNTVWDTMAAADAVPMAPGEGRLGLILPLFHANAQITSLTQFYTGGAVAMWERFSPSDFWETVDRYQPEDLLRCADHAVHPSHGAGQGGAGHQLTGVRDLRRRAAAGRHLRALRGGLRPAHHRRLWADRGDLRVLAEPVLGRQEAGLHRPSRARPADEDS